MNIDNLNKAIAVMKRARARDSVNMTTFQSKSICRTENEFHRCGNTACFAGHIAISPEWLGTSKYHSVNSFYGSPVIIQPDKPHDIRDEYAIAEWLGIREETALYFIYNEELREDEHVFYGVKWEDVKAHHVVRELKHLRDVGEREYCKLKGVQYEFRELEQSNLCDGESQGT